jgi:hypothetical protein
MFIDDCINCKIIIGPCDGSIFIRTSKNCQISVITKQLRFRECHEMKIFAYCPSDPVVESSSLISFGPYNIISPHLKELFTKAKFNESILFLILIQRRISTNLYMTFLKVRILMTPFIGSL